MKLLRLTNCPIPAMVDDRFYDYLISFNWQLGQTKTSKRIYTCFNKRTIYLAREIAYIMGLDLSNDIDHKDGNIFNDLAINLRSATRSQNIANSKVHNTSGFKGAYYDILAKKYRASIRVNNKQIHLGLFNNPIDAALAYDTAAREYYGEFATLNFPLKDEQSCNRGN